MSEPLCAFHVEYVACHPDSVRDVLRLCPWCQDKAVAELDRELKEQLPELLARETH